MDVTYFSHFLLNEDVSFFVGDCLIDDAVKGDDCILRFVATWDSGFADDEVDGWVVKLSWQRCRCWNLVVISM